MSTYEGLWDCPNCKKVGNKGHSKHCGGCGAPRNPDTEFYLPDDAREVTEEAELAKTEQGPDWTCAYCQGDSPAGDKFCSNCGAGADGSKPRQVKEERFAPPVTEDPGFDDPRAGIVEDPPEPKRSSHWMLKGCGLGCLGMLVLAILFSVWLASPREAKLQVVGHAWNSSIAVQQFRQVDESAWEGQVPLGARVTSRHRALNHVNHVHVGTTTHSHEVQERVQSGTHKVKVGKKNMGNGYFKDIYEDQPTYHMVSRTVNEQVPNYHDEPVYGMKVYYRVGRWANAPPVTRQGTGLNPEWPPFRASANERESGRQQELLVRLRDRKGNIVTYTAHNDGEWRSLREGQSYKGMVNGDVCKELKL